MRLRSPILGQKTLFVLGVFYLLEADLWAVGKRMTPFSDPISHSGLSLVPLSQALDDRSLIGLSLEPVETRDQYENWAQEFLKFRSGRQDPVIRNTKIQACANTAVVSQGESDPFCPAILKRVSSTPANRGRRVARDSEQKISKLIRQRKVEELSTYKETELLESLKRMGRAPTLRSLVKKVLSSTQCSSPLSTALGLKMEEGFPELGYRELARSLYNQSSRCSTDASAVKARYRLGLILIWEMKYSEAEAVLASIYGDSDVSDYLSRVTYWRFFCARQSGNSQIEAQMKSRLARDYLMSVHGLLTNAGKELLAFPAVNESEPGVSFRSVSKPDLNTALRAAEALGALDAPEAAVEILEPYMDELKAAEAPVQLYVAVLMRRAEEPLKKFQVLSGMFREHPEFISKGTLEMLYPLYAFETIKDHEEKIDPFLVLSLIRQESGFNERARSRAGARGLMQLLPGTARRMERVSRHQLFEPKTNIRLGVKFLSRLLERYGGDAELALAAYNAGPEKVDEWKRRYPIENRLLFLDLLPFRETREYVASIVRNYYWYLRLYDKEALHARIQTGRRPSSAQVFPLFFPLNPRRIPEVDY